MMKRKKYLSYFIIFFSVFLVSVNTNIFAQDKEKEQVIDKKVKAFFDKHRGSWRDMNVPESDGKLLFDIIIENQYTKALEIGTSTGYSGVWIAWALSKTGGKLITIDIDERRHKIALANFEEAGLSEYIDARLADAHQLVKELKGPFDFVFSDADKGWYKNYFIDVNPKLEINGCFTAHNISEYSRDGGRYRGRRQGGSRSGTAIFYDYVRSLANMETTHDSRGGGMSISYKKSKQ